MPEEVRKLTQEKVWEFIQLRGTDEFEIERFRNAYGIPPDSKVFYSAIHRLVEQNKIKKLGRARYKRVESVLPVRWWEDTPNEEPLDFRFPRSYTDDSEFGFEELAEIFAGDVVLVSGATNYGKTTFVLNILGENLKLMPCVLMGSEYTAADGKISPKFKRRMNRMNWANWVIDGEPQFELLPIGSDYEDHVKPDALNVIDWVSLPNEYYLIDSVSKGIKDRVGRGVGVIVLQKNRDSENPEGGERAERYADFSVKIDPFGDESRITIGKVKAPKGRATGRMWAFGIVDYGANIQHIREIVKCPKCWGKGWVKEGQNSKPCPVCFKLGYIDK